MEEVCKKARAIVCWKVKPSQEKDLQDFSKLAYRVIKDVSIDESCLERNPFKAGLSRALGFHIFSNLIGLKFNETRLCSLLRQF